MTMALRFVALTGPAAVATETAHESWFRAAGLSPVLSTGNCRIWVNSARQALLLGNNRGAVLGTVFRGRTPATRIVTLSAIEEQDVERSLGRSLIEHFWGGYVAFLRTSESLDVIRDPSGAMPCYDMLIDTDGNRVLFSDLETLKASGFRAPSVDWLELNKHLVAYDLRTERTALSGLMEVIAGTKVRFEGVRRKTESYWSPADFARRATHRPPAERAGQLYQIVHGVVSAWAGVFKRPLLGVSGGLDSSIVAAVLAAASPAFVAVTLATDEGDGDERKYVRALGTHLKLDVAERFHRLEDVDVTRSISSHLPRPLLMAFGQSELGQKLELAAECGADCFFSGVGGDNVFCNIRSASPVLDRVMAEGLSIGSWGTIGDVGTLTGASHLEIIAAAAQRLLAGKIRPWFTNTCFLSDDAAQASETVGQHLWLDDAAGIGPGKQAHLTMLARIQGTIDGYSRVDAPVLVNPLLSQPLVEFCLTVPTWTWIAGGQNRSLARQAFKGHLPPVLLERTSKGTPNSFAFEVIDRNRKRLREHLLDGCLSRHGLLDLAAVEGALAPNRTMKGFEHMRLSFLAEAESWARLQS